MRHRSCGSLAWTGVSGLSHQLSPADTHTSRRCGVSPEIPRTPIHTIRSAVRRSEHPSCSPLAIAARSCTVNIRRTNNPLPDKHCCYDPMTPPVGFDRFGLVVEDWPGFEVVFGHPE